MFPVGIGLRDPRSQKRDLGHPSISPFNVAAGTSFVVSLPTRSHRTARDDKGEVGVSMRIGGGCGPVGAGHTNGAPQVPRLPRISCQELWLRSTACGSLGENHKRGADESSAAGNPGTLGMTKRRGSLQGKGWLLNRGISKPIWTGLKFSRPCGTKSVNPWLASEWVFRRVPQPLLPRWLESFRFAVHLSAEDSPSV